MNLTGKDLKAYRNMLKLTQRQFARAYDANRGTLAGYEWSEKKLPNWIIDKIMRFDPNFCFWCLQNREVHSYLKKNYEMKKENKSWLARFIGWLMEY